MPSLESKGPAALWYRDRRGCWLELSKGKTEEFILLFYWQIKLKERLVGINIRKSIRRHARKPNTFISLGRCSNASQRLTDWLATFNKGSRAVFNSANDYCITAIEGNFHPATNWFFARSITYYRIIKMMCTLKIGFLSHFACLSMDGNARDHC